MPTPPVTVTLPPFTDEDFQVAVSATASEGAVVGALPGNSATTAESVSIVTTCRDGFEGSGGACVCATGYAMPQACEGGQCSCDPCEIGFFKPAPGNDACLTCKEVDLHSTTRQVGATEAAACVCLAGFQNVSAGDDRSGLDCRCPPGSGYSGAHDGGCDVCRVGFYKEGYGNGGCASCRAQDTHFVTRGPGADSAALALGGALATEEDGEEEEEEDDEDDDGADNGAEFIASAYQYGAGCDR